MRRLMSSFTERALTRLRSERGFTMVTVMGVMLAGTILTAAAVKAADGDIMGSQKDDDQKAAYAAAEAGVNNYQFHLDRDNNYWTKCANAATTSAVSLAWNGSGADPRRWRNVPKPGVSPTGPASAKAPRYAIEVLPANGAAKCLETDPDTTMIDSASNTFRVRATGVSRKAKRSLMATFKRRSFLDYVYFTDIETADPTFLAPGAFSTWSAQNCLKWWRDGRGTPLYTDANGSRRCTEINFISNENIKGPFHTNDEILICGTPTFGERSDDSIETSGPLPTQTNPGWRGNPGCAGNAPNFVGTFRDHAPVLQLPLSNAKLKQIAQAGGYLRTGVTDIKLVGSKMQINGGGAVDIPANGVIYVDSAGTGCQPYDNDNPYPTYAGNTDCANVTVSGSYSGNLTIAAANDIIINGDLKRVPGSPALIGLIANQFVRVYHPVEPGCGDNLPAANQMKNVRVDAAMMALTHVFVVDNYQCGEPMGTLNVTGGIAQKFRGTVGTFSTQTGQTASGYSKNYTYDRRLRFREPPFFLDPVQASWHVVRQTEQLPAR